jgi:hypothetical protein
MIKVEKPEPRGPEWLALKAAAAAARNQAIWQFEQTGDVQIDEKLFKKFMPYLLKVFKGKCAYCETVISSNQPGDVEHFRPKGRVVDDNFRPIRVKYARWDEIDHPGYFWLAYCWENLLPSCIDCNRYRRHGSTADDGSGKADRFPVDGNHAYIPGEEANETPLLINPADPAAEPPEVHLEFLPDGRIKARTKAGEKTLSVLGLNKREALVKERGRSYKQAYSVVKDWVRAAADEHQAAEQDKLLELQEIGRGEQAYTAMQRLAIDIYLAALAAKGFSLKIPP